MERRRCVVGFDGSPGARAALRWALAHAAPDDDVVAVAVRPAAVAAEDLEELLATQARPVRLQVEHGRPGPALAAAAAGAHCLAVGRRAAGVHLGSVADHCLRHATVPLVVVPPDGRLGDGAVVVGVDGSDAATAALRWAAAEADRGGRRLVAVHAFTKVRQPEGFDPGYDEAEARAWVTGHVAEVFGARPVTVEVTNDLPARALLGHSARGDLVVVGTRGRSAPARAVLGSVSGCLAHRARGPVAVVRPPS
jgi:nucleotide-binding universal stress UspA family protein